MGAGAITAEGQAQDWGGKTYIVQSLPAAGDGTLGQYVALIRTRNGLYGKFFATCEGEPRGFPTPTIELTWVYYVQFDDGKTGRQMCRHSPTRDTFTKLLEEIVPLVS